MGEPTISRNGRTYAGNSQKYASQVLGDVHLSGCARPIVATWRTPHEVKAQFGNASICGNNRVVFNIAGNKYRLVVEMQYRCGIAWVKFIGTHAQYDEIDVETVNEH